MWASVENGHGVGVTSSSKCERTRAFMMESTRPLKDFLKNGSSATLKTFSPMAGSCSPVPRAVFIGSHAASTEYRKGPETNQLYFPTRILFKKKERRLVNARCFRDNVGNSKSSTAKAKSKQ